MKYIEKVFKIALLLTTVFFFTSAPFSVEAKDCSHIKKLHKKLMCKAGSDVTADEAGDGDAGIVRRERRVSINKF